MSEKVGIKICQYDHNNIYINSYLSIAEAVRKTGAKKTSIQMCIKGKLKTAGGFLWKKSDD